MKHFVKITPVMLVVAMLLTLVGCGNTQSNNSSNATTSNSSSLNNTTENSDTNNTSNPKKSLVAYFSWTGNTQQMAEWIADESGSDIYSITPKEEYGTDYEKCADRAKNELDNGIRPELDNLMDTEVMAQYDTIYVGFPIWWYDLPMSMTSFLEQYDLSGKTIIPFFSHNGSSSGASSLETLSEICEGATVLTDNALSILGDSVQDSESQIREWVNTQNN